MFGSQTRYLVHGDVALLPKHVARDEVKTRVFTKQHLRLSMFIY